MEEFEKNKNLIEDEVDRKKAKHAVYENQRKLEVVRVLKVGNI